MTAAAAAAPQPGGARFWCRIDHDFARDTALIETADRCETSPAVVLSIAVQLRVRESEGRPLGPADLDSLAWFCRVPAELVRRIVETLVGLGRLATAVLRAITRPRSTDDLQRVRKRAAQQRWRAKRHRDRRQLSLLLPISPRSRADLAPISGDLPRSTDDAKPLSYHEPDPPPSDLPAISPPLAPAQIEEIESEHIERKREGEKAKADSVSAARLGLTAEEAKKRDNRFWLITWGRRWAEHTTYRAEEKPLRLALCERMLSYLDCWDRRPPEDARAFEYLVKNMRRYPLDPAFRRAFTGGPDPGLTASLIAGGWYHGSGGATAHG